MPYRTIKQLPGPLRKHLPKAAQEIYKEAFNNAWGQYAKRADSEALAHKVAWSAIKHQYEKHGDRWVKRRGSK